jgi:hypothetical protein
VDHNSTGEPDTRGKPSMDPCGTKTLIATTVGTCDAKFYLLCEQVADLLLLNKGSRVSVIRYFHVVHCILFSCIFLTLRSTAFRSLSHCPLPLCPQIPLPNCATSCICDATVPKRTVQGDPRGVKLVPIDRYLHEDELLRGFNPKSIELKVSTSLQ